MKFSQFIFVMIFFPVQSYHAPSQFVFLKLSERKVGEKSQTRFTERQLVNDDNSI